MRKVFLLLATLALSIGSTLPARASDTDLTLAGLLGSGVDTGNANNNPYALQLGGVIELIVDGWVFGFRGVRTLGTDPDDFCKANGNCKYVKDLRSMGGDLGFEWSLWLLHVGPRFGIGRVREVDAGLKNLYLDPGGVAEIELGPFLGGVDIRYRITPGASELSGLLAYAKLGLRIF
jgi:hypothetical protein